MEEKESIRPVISLVSIQEKLNALQSGSGREKAMETKPAPLPDSPLIRAAAVMALFSPDNIQPMPSGKLEAPDRKAINELIGCSEPVLVGAGQSLGAEFGDAADKDILYRLRSPIRHDILRQLFQNNQLLTALSANSPITLNSNNPLQQMMTRCLTGDLPNVTNLQPEQLRGLDQVLEWLSGIEGMTLPDRLTVARQLERAEMLLPLKHLTGIYREGVFVELFRGRSSELTTLREYVGVAAPQGTLEKIRRGFSGYLESIFSLYEKPPLLITGMGGAGKSTLLAKFILSHAEAQEKDRFPFVYLDFDRPNISAMEPETLLVEAARQLAIQYADLEIFSTNAREFYSRWNGNLPSLDDPAYSESLTLKSRAATRGRTKNRTTIEAEFIDLFSVFPAAEQKPFLLVLDTFEEVQYKGTAYVSEFFLFMDRLQESYPLLRAVFAGRAPIIEFSTRDLVLGDLDAEAARGFLESNGLADAAVAREIVSRVGGNPLTLKLAAELVNTLGTKELKPRWFISNKLFASRLSEMEKQGILYRRILYHIHNPKVRKLANPGLALRFITPELIEQVLSKPCGLDIGSRDEALELFQEMSREVSLVTSTGLNTLRHRPDVRKVMLKLMNQANPEQVTSIHQLAITYYEKSITLSAKAEGFYHRLCLDQSASELDGYWEDGLQQSLLGSTDELPPRAQTYLVARTGIGNLDNATWAIAEDKVKERRAIRQATELLNAGKPADALKIVLDAMASLVTDRITLPVIQMRVLMELGRTDEAAKLARDILRDNPNNPEMNTFRKELELNATYFPTGRGEEDEGPEDGDNSYYDSEGDTSIDL